MTESEKQFVLRVGSFFVTFVLAAATGHWLFITLALVNLGLSVVCSGRNRAGWWQMTIAAPVIILFAVYLVALFFVWLGGDE